MFVKEDFQLQGLGRKMVTKALLDIRSHDKTRPIRVQSAGDAVGFFEKLGFVKNRLAFVLLSFCIIISEKKIM
jgi:GNAT superfamily N-acetyltransferase